VGCLIVEDILTVFILGLMPVIFKLVHLKTSDDWRRLLGWRP